MIEWFQRFVVNMTPQTPRREEPRTLNAPITRHKSCTYHFCKSYAPGVKAEDDTVSVTSTSVTKLMIHDSR